ncbi:unnamed protein product [Calypogeia fissa]
MDPSLDYTTVFEPNWSEIFAAPVEEFLDLGNVELDWCNSSVSGDSNLSNVQQVVSQGAVNGLSYVTNVQQDDSLSGKLSSILQSFLTGADRSDPFLGELASGLKIGDVMEQEEPTGNHSRTTTTAAAAAATGIGPVPIIRKSGQHQQQPMMSPGLMMGAGGFATHSNMAPVLNAAVHPVVQDSNMSPSDRLTQAMWLGPALAEIDKELEQEADKLRPTRRNVKVSTNPQSVIARIRREKIASQLRVLQTLVPGGTKMGTVPMLEEAITYAKLLQQTLEKLQTASDASQSYPRPGL